jgi:hypothetical protein
MAADPTARRPLAWVLSAGAGVAGATLAFLLLNGLLRHRMVELVPFNLAEFLISYRGGFVRRGLIGDALYFVPGLTTLDRVEVVIKIFSLTMFASAAWLLAASVFRYTQSAVATLLIVVQPFSFGYQILTYEWLRKDSFLIACFFASFYCVRGRAAARGRGPWLALANLVSIVAILSHELYGIALLPLLVLLSAATFHAADRRWRRAMLAAVVAWLPALLVMGLLAWHQGDTPMAERIADAWRRKGVLDASFQNFRIVIASDQTADAGLRALGAYLSWAGPAQLGGLLLFWLGTWAVSAGLIALGATVTARDRDRRPALIESAAVVVATAVLFAPLFVMAVDWGRWISIWACVTTALVCSDARQDLFALLRVRAPRPGALPPFASRGVVLALLLVSLYVLPVPMSPVHPCCGVRDLARWTLASRITAQAAAFLP